MKSRLFSDEFEKKNKKKKSKKEIKEKHDSDMTNGRC